MHCTFEIIKIGNLQLLVIIIIQNQWVVFFTRADWIPKARIVFANSLDSARKSFRSFVRHRVVHGIPQRKNKNSPYSLRCFVAPLQII